MVKFMFLVRRYNGDLKGYFHGSQNIQGQVRNYDNELNDDVT